MLRVAVLGNKISESTGMLNNILSRQLGRHNSVFLSILAKGRKRKRISLAKRNGTTTLHYLVQFDWFSLFFSRTVIS